MPDEINFLDLAVLTKIPTNTPLEKLGGLINSSIFDASNIAGTLKQKGLIEFSANYPGPNAMNITEQGTALIKEATDHTNAPFDKLDDSVLSQLSGGKRLPNELQSTLNIRPKDLAFRIFKLNKQGFLTYEIKNGSIELMLTEKGFLKVKADTNQPIQQGQVQSQNQNMPSAPQAQGNTLSRAASSINSVMQNQVGGAWDSTKTTNPGPSAQTAPNMNIEQQSQAQSSNIINPNVGTSTTQSQNMSSGLKSEKKKWEIIILLVIILIIVFVIAKVFL
ncbi:MAG: hypothetical protein ACP5M9_03430 [Candidatus Micrarchaeia archaeon]